MADDNDPPAPAALLAVDLDGTLHAGDMAAASLARLCLAKPWLLPAVPLWLGQGRLALKLKLAQHVRLDMAQLAWNDELIAFLKLEAANGRRLVLATGAAKPLAAAAAAHLASSHQLKFAAVLAATARRNPIGAAKAALLAELAGAAGFDYVGDSPRQDPPVFAAARICHFVNPTRALIERFGGDQSKVFTLKLGALARLRRRLLHLLQAQVKDN